MPMMMSHFSPFPIDTPALRVQGLGVQELMRPCFLDRPNGWPNYLFIVFHDATPCRTRDTLQRVPPGTVICWRPGTPHGLGDAERPWNHSWLSVSGRDVVRAIRDTAFPMDTPRPLHDLSFFDPCLADLYNELSRPPKGNGGLDETVTRNSVVNVIRRLARALRPAEARVCTPPALLDLRRHIDLHFHEPLALAGLAERAELSVSQLCFLHQRYFGASVMSYVRWVRLQRAALLLRDSALKVRTVAEMVGYPDHYHFSKAFRRQFGQPPARFRTGIHER